MTSDNGASRTNPGSEESTIASVTNAALEALRSEVERLRQDLHAVCSMDAFYADNGNDETVLVVPVADVREVLHGPS